MEKFIDYVRTSTGKQVLGLEEQISHIHQVIQSSVDELIGIYFNNTRKRFRLFGLARD